jgi:hypothetical protein
LPSCSVPQEIAGCLVRRGRDVWKSGSDHAPERGSKVVVIGVAVAGLAALAGGWAFASLGPGTLPWHPLPFMR